MKTPLLIVLFSVVSCLFAPDESHTLFSAEKHLLHSWRKITLSSQFFSEGADVGDFNKDGKVDIISGPYWYEGPDFQEKHVYRPPTPFNPGGYSDCFFSFTEDFNADGWVDILVIGFPGKEAFWFENPKGKDRLWERHLVMNMVDNESPMFVDITGDGKREILCSTEGFFGYAEPDAKDAYKPWTFHKISPKVAGGRFTHGLGYGDVNGDGRIDLLEKNGWWEQPASLKDDPEWKRHPFTFSGPGGAQMYAYDFDGDGDNDVLTSLAAHGFGLAWYEQIQKGEEITFKQHLIMGSKPEQNDFGVKFSQLHAVDLADIDRDGLLDIVTGKRYWAHGPKGDPEPGNAPVVYWFRTTRTKDPKTNRTIVKFTPYLIDDDSGVGTEVKTRDLNGDGLLDVIVGNKKGTFAHLQSQKEVTEEEWKKNQPMSRQQSARPIQRGLPKYDGLSPAEAAKAITVPEGFKVHLAAGEPTVHQPIAFTIDERGRLWIAEAHTYPQRAPEGKGKDKILILEDTNGDGTFDQRTVFAEGLNLVSGLEVGFGGVWIGAAPYLLFIPDRNHDDKPDAEPTVLLDGFGYHDTHETLNSFIWGPDGWLYGCHGVFTHSNVGKPGTSDSKRVPLNAGIWRYHPVRHTFEIFAYGTSNPWGVDFNEQGQAFATACVIPHLYHIIQGARYQRQAGQHFQKHTYDDIRTIAEHLHYAGSIRDHAWWGRDNPVAHMDTDAAGGGHAHCGAMIYLGDNWPDRYRNQIFMNNIHGNRVNQDRLQRKGSGYKGSRAPDFLFANDRWYRGISLKYGPDGGVYLIDWYDKNACHRRTPEIWDRTNGRIFKVSYGDSQPKFDPFFDLSKRSDDELISLLKHKNHWYVRTASRLLQERSMNDEQKRKQLAEQFAELALSDEVTPSQRLIGLWNLGATGSLEEETALKLLSDSDEYLRAWTIQLLCEEKQNQTGPVIQKFTHLAENENSQLVRLYLASALQRLPLAQRVEVGKRLVQHGKDADDHNLPLMYWYGLEEVVDADASMGLELASLSKIPLITRFIYRRLAAEPVYRTELLRSLKRQLPESSQLMILEEVANVVKTRGELDMPKVWPEIYTSLAKSSSEQIRNHAQFITVKFGDKSLFPALRKILSDRKSPMQSRLQALQALQSGRDAELPPVLHEMLNDDSIRSAALKALAGFDHKATPNAILNTYANFTPEEKSDAVTTLASRVPSALILLNAIERKQIPRTDLSAYTVSQMQKFSDPKLLKKLNEVWGTIRTTPAEKQKLLSEYKQRLTPALLAKADLPHGRELYNKTCVKCHRLFGEGGKIGPDITGSNRANLDYLLLNMLDPNAVVGKDYQTTTIALTNGRLVQGLIKEENESAVVVQTVNDVVVVPKKEIEERKLSTESLMPEGQLKDLSTDDVRDLVAYLASPYQVPLPGAGPFFNPKTNRVTGAIEGESMKILSKTAGNAASQKMNPFPKDKWSGIDHLWWTGAKPGDRLTLELPVKSPGTYELYTVMTRARDYGIVQVSLDGKRIGKPIDLYHAPDVITTGVLSLGTHELKSGPHRITIEIVGANPKAVKAYMFGLDYFHLSAVKKNDDKE